jgi:beta-mannanase
VPRRLRSNPRRLFSGLAVLTLAGAAGFICVLPAANATVTSTRTSTVTVAAADDTYVSSARPTYRFGSNASLIAGTSNGDRMYSYLRFAVAPLPVDATVTRVELRLTREAQQWPSSVTVNRVDDELWSESSVSWNSAPALGAELATVQPDPSAATISLDVSALVRNAGVYTMAVTSTANDIARFKSSYTGADGPQLLLTYEQPATSTIEVAAADDTYVSSARPAYRFGSNASLIAGTANGDRMNSYVRFTVGALPAGTTVTGAEVRLTRETRVWPPVVALDRVTDDLWSESSVSWNSAPALGAELAAVRPEPTAPTITLDVTALVRASGVYSMAITSPATNDIARIRSSDAGADGPKLVLTLKHNGSTAPATAAPADCTVDAKLVPTCGVLWGAAAGGFLDTPRDAELSKFEEKTGRTATLFHAYHKGDEQFPTAGEIAMARDPQRPRTLLLNWKVDYGTTWAAVARGETDARIDRLSAYIKANVTEKFFMVLHHEPEADVNQTAGSGMTAKDFAAMFGYTVRRMRANGVNNVLFVVAYMNYEKWNNTTWWKDLYPGDDVVDWVGVDSYNNAQPGGFHSGDFLYLANRTTDKTVYPGWYTWASTEHPAKPLMVAEWGVYDESPVVRGADKAAVFDSVLAQLSMMPRIKALVYFETPSDLAGRDIRVDDTPEAAAAFGRIAADPRFNVKLR